MEHSPITELPRQFRALLSESMSDDRDIKICEITCSISECIDDFRCRELPSPTQEYNKWKWMHTAEREDFIKSNPVMYKNDILGFGDKIDAIKNINSRNKQQLVDWLRLEICDASRIKVLDILDSHRHTYTEETTYKPVNNYRNVSSALVFLVAIKGLL